MVSTIKSRLKVTGAYKKKRVLHVFFAAVSHFKMVLSVAPSHSFTNFLLQNLALRSCLSKKKVKRGQEQFFYV